MEKSKINSYTNKIYKVDGHSLLSDIFFMKRDVKMKKNIGITLLLILTILLTGCGKNDDIKKENISSKEDISNMIDYERQVLNATVNINTDSGDFGAGFIYNEIYIITNYHVIFNAKEISAVRYNRDKFTSSLVGFNSENDIAVLKSDKKLDSMILGDSDKISIGSTVTAIGNPNGDLSFSKAEGKILKLSQELLDIFDKERKYIWYDGNAISGYSGGPVYDKEGKVIGILNARYVGDLSKYDFDNLCAIIPINRAKQIIDKIIYENS